MRSIRILILFLIILKSRIADKTEEYYILLDEIQYAISSAELRDKDKPPGLYGVLNGLIGMKNADVYITGSNSRLLSMIIFFMAGFRLFCRSIQWKTR